MYFLTVPTERSCSCKCWCHKSSSSWIVAAFRFVFRDITRCCMEGPFWQKNVSRCYFDGLAGAVSGWYKRGSDRKYTIRQREITVSRSSRQVKPLYTPADFRHTD